MASANNTLLGPNVYVFDPSMPAGEVQEQATKIFQQMEANQFGPERYALLFKPGTYPVLFDVGFYTSVAGLGQNPDQVRIEGGANVPAYWMPNRNATCNFWRSYENLAIEASDATNKTTTIAVSQAAPLRRLHITSANGLWLFQVDPSTHAGGWASGGFMADSVVDGQVLPGSQQQWLSRNCGWGSWANGVWNMVFVGCDNAPSGDNFPTDPYTTIDRTPILREKPYLYHDGGRFAVFVPSLQRDTQGPSWKNQPTPGRSVSVEDEFHVAQSASSTSASLNEALRAGKHILFTPGVYQLDEPLQVTKAGTIVLGLGFATLIPKQGGAALTIADVDGVTIAGFIVDAGPVNSPAFEDPTFLYDITVRTGGAQAGKNDVGINVHSHDVVCDQLWLWRADHGPGSGWDSNPTKSGIVVNGDNVTIYGLFNEHHEEYQTVWNGQNGRVYFYQSEIPYDPPSQERYMSGGQNGAAKVNGYASYKVADHVDTHEAWGLGVYSYYRDFPAKTENAIEVPGDSRPGVKLHRMTTIWLNGLAGSEITHIVNGKGDRVYGNPEGMRATMNEFP
ncbi:hypothetical protein PG999_012942 [Apiospora kogelbergensis]|uniref:Coagulation factor 5/8 type domain-containing protein n=1 Tax=Apiospora kogelbergensis TaxID=1337665 RepID=A0AAW0QPS4_9PEZI